MRAENVHMRKYDMDDYIDDDGTIWIWKVLNAPVHPESNPRHLSPEIRERLIQHRIAQIEREAARNVALLRSLSRN